MRYSIDPEVLARYPNFVRGVVVALNVDNSSASSEYLHGALQRRIRQIEQDDHISLEHPRIQAWVQIYRTFSVKGSRKMQPSVGSLVRRIKKGKGDEIPFISSLVCISNLVSLSHLVPSGSIDASRVIGDLRLGYATGVETFEPFGADRCVAPEPGELILFDTGAGVVICGAWNSKGGKKTAVEQMTSSAIIDVDGLADFIDIEELKVAAETAAYLIEKHCGGTTRVYWLNNDNPSVDIL